MRWNPALACSLLAFTALSSGPCPPLACISKSLSPVCLIHHRGLAATPFRSKHTSGPFAAVPPQTTEVFYSDPIDVQPAGVSFTGRMPLRWPAGRIGISSVRADLIDEGGIPVPLSKAYVHHWNMLAVRNESGIQKDVAGFGAGSEFRNLPEELPAPYSIILDGTEQWFLQVCVRARARARACTYVPSAAPHRPPHTPCHGSSAMSGMPPSPLLRRR